MYGDIIYVLRRSIYQFIYLFTNFNNSLEGVSIGFEHSDLFNRRSF